MDLTSQTKLYMDIAKRVAQESYCGRGQVGACIVTPHKGIFVGFNGTPVGFNNVCELVGGITSPLVIHAEQNALLKMLKEGVSPVGSTVYQTLSPCMECCKWLYSAGVYKVVYSEVYRDATHLSTFTERGLVIEKYKPEG